MSLFWSDNINLKGIMPPNPKFVVKPVPAYIEEHTLLPSPYTNINYSVGVIQSNREPYAVIHMNNGYGQLNTKFGTNLGRN